AAERNALPRQLAQLARNPAIQELLGEVSADTAGSKEIQLVALRAMSQASLKETPGAWTNALPRALAQADDTIVQAAIAVVRAQPAAKTNTFDFSPYLLRAGLDVQRSTEVRLEALAAMREGLSATERDLFDFLRSNVDAGKSPMTRTTAASVMGRAKLTDEQLLALAETLKTVGPMEISRLITAFDNTTTE